MVNADQRNTDLRRSSGEQRLEVGHRQIWLHVRQQLGDPLDPSWRRGQESQAVAESRQAVDAVATIVLEPQPWDL